MEKEESKKITPDPQKELTTTTVIDDKKYLVLTEDYGYEKNLIVTQVYLGGKIVSTKKTDYKHILNVPEPEKRIMELMQEQHEKAIKMLREEEILEKGLADYLDEIRNKIKRKYYKSALALLESAFENYPNNPFLLSYYGYLEAALNKNNKRGIETCLGALRMLKGNIPDGLELFYPVLYLNLGKTYLAAGYKKAAIDTFYKGLTFDHENKDILEEIKKLVTRKDPVVGFLPRSHPLNKYLGKLRHKLKSP
jgi:tetratricopeptide (TPR) repeat protein